MTKKTRVLIICGGKSAEHEVSLVSALSVAKALDKNKFDVNIVDEEGEKFTKLLTVP